MSTNTDQLKNDIASLERAAQLRAENLALFEEFANDREGRQVRFYMSIHDENKKGELTPAHQAVLDKSPGRISFADDGYYSMDNYMVPWVRPYPAHDPMAEKIFAAYLKAHREQVEEDAVMLKELRQLMTES